MRCAGCDGELVGFSHSGIALDRCADCRGVWFDAAEALAYLHGSAVGERVEAGAPTAGEGASHTCPRCRVASCGAHEVQGVAFLKCDRCGGAHVPAASLAVLHGRARRERRRNAPPGVMSGADWLDILASLFIC